MEAFKSHRGIIAPLDRANVDTDQIIAKQFLKSIKRTGFGEHLFHDWRFAADGKPNTDFELNDPAFKEASILIARNNFGCGSSREHAVWAIKQYGFRAIIAPKLERGKDLVPAFADIFRNNSAKNGLLTVELSETDVDQIFQMIGQAKGLQATVDLEQQRVILHAKDEVSFHFEIEPSTKEQLIQGLDEISQTLNQEQKIQSFESSHNPQWQSDYR